MPELPEVETIKRELKDKIVGQKIAKLKVLRRKSFQGKKNQVAGRKIVGIGRQAKVLIIKLEGQLNLLVHLKMTGQLLYRKKLDQQGSFDYKPEDNVYDTDVLPNKYTRVLIKLKEDGWLVFNDLRVFGWIKAVKDGQLETELENFAGVDPLSKQFTFNYLENYLASTGRAIKLALMDQKKIGGIGNIYANEALFCAGIDPRSKSRAVVKKTSAKVKDLKSCLIDILKKAIEQKGTTNQDEAFRTSEGGQGGMQNHLKVYGREGESCFECSSRIKKVKLAGRATYFCPACQELVEANN